MTIIENGQVAASAQLDRPNAHILDTIETVLRPSSMTERLGTLLAEVPQAENGKLRYLIGGLSGLKLISSGQSYHVQDKVTRADGNVDALHILYFPIDQETGPHQIGNGVRAMYATAGSRLHYGNDTNFGTAMSEFNLNTYIALDRTTVFVQVQTDPTDPENTPWVRIAHPAAILTDAILQRGKYWVMKEPDDTLDEIAITAIHLKTDPDSFLSGTESAEDWTTASNAVIEASSADLIIKRNLVKFMKDIDNMEVKHRRPEELKAEIAKLRDAAFAKK